MKSILISFLLLGSIVSAEDARFQSIQFLFGKWKGKGGGAGVGEGQGSYSYTPDLNNNVVIRRNFAEYPTGPRHDDLMIIYAEGPATNALRAIYFDSEGHVIRYNLTMPTPTKVVFESDRTQPGPRYRLTHVLEGQELTGRFEVAAPGGDFKSYLSWTSVRE
jgi:hypothetical protein